MLLEQLASQYSQSLWQGIGNGLGNPVIHCIPQHWISSGWGVMNLQGVKCSNFWSAKGSGQTVWCVIHSPFFQSSFSFFTVVLKTLCAHKKAFKACECFCPGLKVLTHTASSQWNPCMEFTHQVPFGRAPVPVEITGIYQAASFAHLEEN